MLRKILLPLVCMVVSLLAGCFDITEEVFLEKNGSGRFVSTLDLSQMKDMLAMLKTMMPDSLSGDGQGIRELDKLDSIPDYWKGLEKIPGISEIRREKKGEMVFALSFRFSDIRALNAAMSARNQKDSQVVHTSDFFSFKPGYFACNDTTMGGAGAMMKGLDQQGSAPDSVAMGLDMMKGFMGDMKYSSVIHLPGKVVSYSNKLAKLDDDSRTVRLIIKLTEADSSHTLKNEIRYK